MPAVGFDYRFADNLRGRKFLDALGLTDEDRRTLAHGNVERMLELNP